MRNTTFSIVVFLSISSLTGCALVPEIPKDREISSELTPVTNTEKKIDAHIVLILENSLLKNEYGAIPNYPNSGIRIGNNLSKNIENIARTIFNKVTIVNSKPEKIKSEWDALITPKLNRIVEEHPIMTWNDSTTIVETHWKMTNKDGVMIWRKVIISEVSMPIGAGWNSFESQQERLRLALIENYKKLMPALLKTRASLNLNSN